jgi:hypothetical protein
LKWDKPHEGKGEHTKFQNLWLGPFLIAGWVCWLWSLIVFLMQGPFLSAVSIPHEVFTPSLFHTQRGGTPSAGSRGSIPPAGGSGGKRAPNGGSGAASPDGGSGVKSPKKKFPYKSIL